VDSTDGGLRPGILSEPITRDCHNRICPYVIALGRKFANPIDALRFPSIAALERDEHPRGADLSSQGDVHLHEITGVPVRYELGGSDVQRAGAQDVLEPTDQDLEGAPLAYLLPFGHGCSLPPYLQQAPSWSARGERADSTEDSAMNPFAWIWRQLQRGPTESDDFDVDSAFMPLEATPGQLSYWTDHPNETKVFRHTEATARMVDGQPALKAALFAFRLPFDLPVPNGAVFALRRSPDPDGPPWVHLTVERIKIDLASAALAPYERGLEVLLGEAKAKLKKGASSQTWVTAQTLNLLYEDEPFELTLRPGGAASVGFERCLRAINIVCDASRLILGEQNSRPLTKESLDSWIAWVEVDGATGEISEQHHMGLHTRVINPVCVVDDPEETLQRLSVAVSRRLESDACADPHPLLMPRLLAQNAWVQLWHGDYPGAVITLQTATETLLTGLYKLLLVDEGLDSRTIDRRTQAPFRNVLRTQLPVRLRGRWTGTGAVPEVYWAHVYVLRNDLAHAGRQPPWWTLNAAYAAYENLVEFIDARVLADWRNHPRTLVAWCEDWAGGNMELPSAAKTVAEGLHTERSPYWLPRDAADR
jgi:hypothetical protein